MKIYVKLFSVLRELANRKEDVVEVDDKVDVGKLILILKKKYGPKFGRYVVNEMAGIQSYIKVMINGRDIEFLDGSKTRLGDGDTVQIIPPVRGGLAKVLRCY